MGRRHKRATRKWRKAQAILIAIVQHPETRDSFLLEEINKKKRRKKSIEGV